jgi:hypothetical protein
LTRDANQSEGASTLPAPELNPLVNPVLGQHMGRWAEVYFTAPPEKREQAVLELLRELQGEPEPASAAATGPEPAPRIAEAQQASSRCPWCGRENPASHRFCGICGKSVAKPAIADRHSDVRIADLHITDEEIADHLDPSSFDGATPLREPVLRTETPALHSVSTQAGSYARHTDEEPIFRRERDLQRSDLDDEIFHYPPASRSYGVFLGLALVVALLAIGYVVWRTYGAPQAHDAAQASPSVAATEPATQPAPDPAPPTISKPDVPEHVSEHAPEPASSASQPTTASESARVNNQANARTRERKSASAEPIRSVAAAEKNPTPDASAGNGAEELVTAQRYLNGTAGQERNRSEGAKWLWKAVSKHNADATLLLADLYLRGEGVGKSCDQAHVLLDAAARQGIKGAGDKLRHLEAFGCQ